MTTFTELSATEMARLVRAKKISPVELVQAHLERAENLQPHLNAFVQIDGERAMRAAREAEASLMHGDAGALLGVPVSIKNSIQVSGLRCETGSRLLAGSLAARDATLVQRLKRAGAIILGTTNAPEMLMAYDTDNALYFRTNNPWDLQRTPGGSSGGEAAAIASGCSAAGVGSDGGGSIRVPAHFSGICGLKPTPGRIPATGHTPPCVGPSALIGVVGPMARTIADLRLMVEVMSGPDAGDPMAAPFSPAEVRLRELRIAVFVDDGGGTPVSPETSAAVNAAVVGLSDAGLHVDSLVPEGLERARELWQVLFCDVAVLALAPIIKDHNADLSPSLRKFLAYATSRPPLTAEKLLQTLVARDELRARFLAQMETHQVLLAPVSCRPAFGHGEAGWGCGTVDYLDDMRFTQWFNLLGNPAAVVPVGQSPEGLPIGVQVIGRPYEEETVLAVAAVIEQRFGTRRPPMQWAAAGA